MELDLYERDIIDMATRYPGKGFYEYHRQFSLMAASHLRFNNIMVDWSVRKIHYSAISLPMRKHSLVHIVIALFILQISVLWLPRRKQKNCIWREKSIHIAGNDCIMQERRSTTTLMAQEDANYLDVKTLIFV